MLNSATRILFVIPTMRLGGAEAVMATWLRHLDNRLFEPHLALLRAEGVRLESLPSHVAVHDLRVTRARYAVLPLARLCWKLRPQLVVSMCTFLNATVVAARPLLPRGTGLALREGSDIFARENCIQLALYRLAYRMADMVICQSEYMKLRFLNEFGLQPRKVMTIYNPVEIDRLNSLAGLPLTRPFASSGPNLVAVGRLTQEKGFDLLLRSMNLVHSSVPGASLTIIGDGPDLPRLRTLQAELNLESAVRFLGAQNNPYPFVKNADLLVLPSRSEGLPNVVLEAVALGTPVVATNCTGAMKEIEACTDRFFLAHECTPVALAGAIVDSLASGRAGSAGPSASFEARFGVAPVMAELERSLATVAGVSVAQNLQH